jgi:folate-binding protein YgfZ
MSEPLSPIFAVDHSADTLLAITGADRTKILHNFCTNDIKGLTPGQGREAFITSAQGKTIGHVIVDCQEDRLLLHAVPGQAEKLIKHLDRYIISEDATLKDVRDEYEQWLVAGPEAEAKLASAGIELPAEMLGAKGTETRVQKVPYLGTSYLITIPKANDESLLREIPKLAKADLLAGLRIDANWPLFGSDITDDNLPQEIHRDRQAISFKKGCYLGQETVARLDALGHVNKILARVQLPVECPPGTELSHDGKVVGKLTSVGYSPTRSAWIAFALLRVAQAKAGTKLQTDAGEAEVF